MLRNISRESESNVQCVTANRFMICLHRADENTCYIAFINKSLPSFTHKNENNWIKIN